MSQYVLLAESDSRYAQALEPLMTEANYRFASAYSLKEARSLAVVETPALLLLDMDHPTREAMRLLTDLRARGLDTPVLWVSSHVSKSEIECVRGSGAQGLLLKDANAPTTLRAIKTTIAGRTFFEENQPTRKNSGSRSLSMDDRLLKLLQG